jgi:hypothetical protein
MPDPIPKYIASIDNLMWATLVESLITTVQRGAMIPNSPSIVTETACQYL